MAMRRHLAHAGAVTLALGVLAGCYGASDARNPDLLREFDRCHARRSSPEAVAACRAFLARPDPGRWPGATGTDIYGYGLLLRTQAAVRLTLHLVQARRYREVVETADVALREDARSAVVLTEIRGTPFPATAPFPPKTPYPPASRGLVLGYRGHAMAQLGDHAGALPSLREALTLLPTWTQVWIVRGTVANVAGEFEESLSALDRAIALDAALADRPQIRMLRQASEQRRAVPPRLLREPDIEARPPEGGGPGVAPAAAMRYRGPAVAAIVTPARHL